VSWRLIIYHAANNDKCKIRARETLYGFCRTFQLKRSPLVASDKENEKLFS